jgi:UrcA family protein
MFGHTRKTRILASLIAMTATLGAASVAQAGAAGQAATHYDSVVVDYSDLNLNSAAGNKVLYARLAAAAERACGKAPPARELKLRAQYRACYDAKLDKAVDKVGSRDLQALHATAAARHVS